MRLPACWWKQSYPLSDVLLQVESLAKGFRTRRAKGAGVKAVAGVSFTLRRGETLGLVGESGCGKSTLSRLILSLLDPDAGMVSIDGIDFINSSVNIIISPALDHVGCLTWKNQKNERRNAK